MDHMLLLKGLVLGFSIAAPVGPIGLLCIKRTLTQGTVVGLLSGFGAATADAVYGGFAAFGLSTAAQSLLSHQHLLTIIGGLFLLYLGTRICCLKPASVQTDTPQVDPGAAFFSTFILTLTNPMTILSFTGVFAGLGVGGFASSPISTGMLVLGVFLGSTFWWLLLSTGVGLLRDKIPEKWVLRINQLSGMVICIYGCSALLSCFIK